MTARAAASEQLSGDIVESLTAGLLVVDRSGRDRDLQRRRAGDGRREERPVGSDYHTVLAAFPPLVQLIEECLHDGASDRASIGAGRGRGTDPSWRDRVAAWQAAAAS